MKEKTLVILAAGMGSRFGGLKQIEPVGPNKEIIADYSIYDAIRCGFTKVVFVIRKEHLDYFKENITKRYQDKIKIEYAFQSFDGLNVPLGRTKMLGTVHAVLTCHNLVKNSFLIINADDFYGLNAFLIASKFIDECENDHEYLTVNYPFYLTVSKAGQVKRGIVYEKNGYVLKFDESYVDVVDDKIMTESMTTHEKKEIDKNHPVAVNFFVFHPNIFNYLEKDFQEFMINITMDNEFLLTNFLKNHIEAHDFKMKSALANTKWLGITYKEDVILFKEELNKLIKDGVYPANLWG